MLGLTGIPAVIELVFLPFFPESPRYMLIQKGDEKNSRKGEKTRVKFALCGWFKSKFNRVLGFVPLSIAASPRLGWCGCRGGRDASGGPVGAGRGPSVGGVPAVPEVSPLAADLHHHYEHGPTAVRGQRGEASFTLCFTTLIFVVFLQYEADASLLLCCFMFFNLKNTSFTDLLLCRQYLWFCRSKWERRPVRYSGDRCSECLHDHSGCGYPGITKTANVEELIIPVRGLGSEEDVFCHRSLSWSPQADGCSFFWGLASAVGPVCCWLWPFTSR